MLSKEVGFRGRSHMSRPDRIERTETTARARSPRKRKVSGVRARVTAPSSRRRRQRRLAGRIVVDLPALVIVERAAARGLCLNLSIGGMCLASDLQPAVGMRISVWLEFGDAEHMLTGVVRWTHDGVIGVQHDSLSAQQTYALSEFLASCPLRRPR